MPAGQQQRRQNIFRAMRHADNVGTDQLRAVKVHRPLQNAEQFQRIGRFGRQIVQLAQVGDGRGQEMGEGFGALRAVHLAKAGEEVEFGEEFVENGRVVLAVLPNIQPRHVQAKHLRLIAHPGQVGVGQVGQAVGPQRGIHQRQRFLQIGHRAQPHRRIGHPFQAANHVAARRFGQIGLDHRRPEAVGFVGVAGLQKGDVFGAVARGGQRRLQLRADGCQLVRHAQRPIEVTRSSAVALHAQPTMQAEGLGGHIGRHVGVAVAVAANPGAKGEETFGPIHRGVMGGQSGGHCGVNIRQHVPQGNVEVVEAGAHFVGDGGFGAAALVRQPERGDFGGDLRFELPAFAGQQIALFHVGEGVCQAAQLGDDRAAFGLGGMRREYQFDVQALQNLAHFKFIDAHLAQGGDGRRDGFGERLGIGGAFAFAQDADAVLLFGEVDQLEINGEAAGDEFGFVQVKAADDVFEALVDGRVGVAAAGFGEGADALFQLEYFDAGVAAHDFAKDVAQEVNFVTEEVLRGIA